MFTEQEESTQQEKQELEARINYALGFIKSTNQKIKRIAGKLVSLLAVMLGGAICSSFIASTNGDLQTFLKVVSILSLTSLPFSIRNAYKIYKMVEQKSLALEDLKGMSAYYQACYGEKKSPFEDFDEK